MKHSKGFTLIELLVVIAIISVLATIIFSSLADVRANARDAQRHRDIRTIQTALKMYYLDHGRYPREGWHHSYGGGWNSLENTMGVKLPRDPLNSGGRPPYQGGQTYSYYTGTSYVGCPAGQWYALVYRIESRTIPLEEFNQSGLKRCDTGVLWRAGNLASNSLTVGVTPAQ